MSSQTKLIKDILSIYDTILENKEMGEAVDSYDNVDFKRIGHGNPASDNISTTLLQDIQTAAKNAGLKVDVTTAVSGHKKGTRHETGQAVDIAIINGIGSDGATSGTNGNAKFRELGNKLKDTLVSMGYVWNSESGNPKAVLWQTNKGGNHFNHVHVSNTTSSSGTTKPSDTNSTTSTPDSTEDSGEFAKKVGTALLKGIGIQEERVYSSFGKNYEIKYGEVIVPKNDNKKIKSSVSGVITSYSYNSSCKNQLVIKFEINGSTFYLEYCGLESHLVRKGASVEKGDLIGISDSDVTITLYDSRGRRDHINPKTETTTTNNDKKDIDDYSKNDESMFTAAYKAVRDTWFKKDDEPKKKDDDEEDRKINPNDSMFTAAYKSAKNALFKKDKLKEDIERIKGLL
jgi:hypothetical protein